MASTTRTLRLANDFQPTRHRAARPYFGRGGHKVFQPASTADISSFIKQARGFAASEGHNHDYRFTSEPLPVPFETTPLEIFALALAVFAIVCVLGCMAMVAIKTKRSREQHESYSLSDSDDTMNGASQDIPKAFIDSVKRLRNPVSETEMNRLKGLERDKTSLAPKHIFRPWREAAIDRKGGNRELGDGSSTGLRTEHATSERAPSTGNQKDSAYTFSKDPVRVSRRASRPFCNNDADATSQNPYSRI
ncbi:hypothetical protein CGRA01v4_06618 [Colletotrichum graminicola]|uniref:Uncharacterized protein n=1 Tax=Colletotrichum graminicola (strain M1.001 / M2 / FGSC 10212) TaxID=645133 RepID=E3Q388_COLGM|nr:uncharacterized protein GLRG_00211 [Colletotrichum graminicola M1.001]EFQ25067.1 hypothetical protein GLRG_00211 [Colletotrichum graminicola M1.001]WDK15337.1 hypothetical protein CGRA01v4_06618 [Colletotrichum graminicola]